MIFRLLPISLLVSSSLQGYVWPPSTLPPTPQLPLRQAAQVGYINVTDNVAIWHARWGPDPCHKAPCDSTPIIFLHGALTNSDWWGHQVSFLLENGYQNRTIISIDSRMQGRSTGWSQPISYYIMMSDVISVLDHLKIPKVTVVGWSDGGIIGEEMLVHTPERVERLFDFAGQINYIENPKSGLQAPTIKKFLPRAATEFAELSPEPKEFNVSATKVHGMKSNFTKSDFEHIPTLYEDCASAPLVWFVDAADEELVANGTARAMSNWVLGSGLVLLPSVSHFAMIQDPDTFNAVLNRFLGYKVRCIG